MIRDSVAQDPEGNNPLITGDNIKAQITFGTYFRWNEGYGGSGNNNKQENCVLNSTARGSCSGHTYHNFFSGGEDVWMQCAVDRSIQNLRDHSSKNWELMIEPFSETPGYGLFDCLADYYVAWSDRILPMEGYDHPEVFLAHCEYYADAASNDVDLIEQVEWYIASLCAAFDVSDGNIKYGFSTKIESSTINPITPYGIEVRYKFGATTYGDTWANLTPLATHSTSGGVYESHWHHIPFQALWDANPGETVVYLAFAVTGREAELGFREISVMKDNAQLPPLPGVNPA